MNHDIKPCPFCGAKGELKEGSTPSSGDGYYMGQDYFIIECVGCGARSGDVNYDFLRDFTDYTVNDFRKNPVLRAKVDDEYLEYKEEKRVETVSLWNNRKPL